MSTLHEVAASLKVIHQEKTKVLAQIDEHEQKLHELHSDLEKWTNKEREQKVKLHDAAIRFTE